MELNALTPEKIAQIKHVLKEMSVSVANPSLIQDNKLIFTHQGRFFRARMPNQMEQTLAEQEQNKTKIRLAREEGNITKKELIKTLKKNGIIDIEEKRKEQDDLKQQLQDVYLEGALISSKDLDKLQENQLKKEEIESKFMEVTIEIAEMLAPCIEEQARIEYYKYLSFLCTEKRIGETDYEKYWKTYEEYINDSTGLPTIALDKLQSLLLRAYENE